jgi:type II secretory pathway pseudopilin PulG
MSAGAVIGIVIVALAIVAFLALVVPRMRARKLEQRRAQAQGHREEAHLRQTRAEREAARADEQSARARRQAAEAEERSQRAQAERSAAREHVRRASELDPDSEVESSNGREEHESTRT